MQFRWIRWLSMWVFLVLSAYLIAPWMMQLWVWLFPQMTTIYAEQVYVFSTSRMIMLLCMIFVHTQVKKLYQFALEIIIFTNLLYLFVLVTDPTIPASNDLEVSSNLAIHSYGVYPLTILFNTNFHLFGIQVVDTVDGYRLKMAIWRDPETWFLSMLWIAILVALLRVIAGIIARFIFKEGAKNHRATSSNSEWWCSLLLASACYWSYQHLSFVGEESMIDTVISMARQTAVNIFFSIPIILLIIKSYKKHESNAF
jgi:hypothetical protein